MKVKRNIQTTDNSEQIFESYGCFKLTNKMHFYFGSTLALLKADFLAYALPCLWP